MDGRCRPTTVVYELGGRSVKYRVRFKSEAG
jgi:hypothetical protein